MKMKITYECEFCGFCSQNKEEVQRCEAQGVKSKFSVGEEVEYALDKEKEQWGRATVYLILFTEKTHEIFCYVIKPKREIAFTIPWPTASSNHHHHFIVYARQIDEEELRPVAKEEEERIEAVNFLVRACIEKGAVDKAQEAAQLGRRNLSTEEIDSLVSVCAKKGWLQKAQKAAKLAGRGLTTKEADIFIEAYIKEGRVDDVLAVVELTGRELATEEVDSLVRACLEDRKKSRENALKAARLGASKEVIGSLLEPYLKSGSLKQAKEVAKLLGRELTRKENECIIKNCIQCGRTDTAQEIAQRLGRKFTAEEVDSLVKRSIKNGNFQKAFEAARLGASREGIEYLLVVCIQTGWIDSAQNAAQLAGRELTAEEINSAARAFLTTGWVYHPSNLKKEALKAIELGASKEAIDSLVGACIKKGWIGTAQEIAKLAGRKLTTEEIGGFRETV